MALHVKRMRWATASKPSELDAAGSIVDANAQEESATVISSRRVSMSALFSPTPNISIRLSQMRCRAEARDGAPVEAPLLLPLDSSAHRENELHRNRHPGRLSTLLDCLSFLSPAFGF